MQIISAFQGHFLGDPQWLFCLTCFVCYYWTSLSTELLFIGSSCFSVCYLITLASSVTLHLDNHDELRNREIGKTHLAELHILGSLIFLYLAIEGWPHVILKDRTQLVKFQIWLISSNGSSWDTVSTWGEKDASLLPQSKDLTLFSILLKNEWVELTVE